MIVDINWVIEVKKKLKEMNKTAVQNITFIKDGKVVEFSKDDLEEFDYMGLTDIINHFDYKIKDKQ